MHHFVTEICTHVHISVTKWCIGGYLSNASWDMWDWSIAMLYILYWVMIDSARMKPNCDQRVLVYVSRRYYSTDNAMKQINIDGRNCQCQWWIAYKTRIIWTIFHQIILINGPLLVDVFMCLMMQSILVSHGPIYSRLYTWLTILLIVQHTVKVNCCMIIVFCFLSFFLKFSWNLSPKVKLIICKHWFR